MKIAEEGEKRRELAIKIKMKHIIRPFPTDVNCHSAFEFKCL